jgi:hypothetical protein
VPHLLLLLLLQLLPVPAPAVGWLLLLLLLMQCKQKNAAKARRPLAPCGRRETDRRAAGIGARQTILTGTCQLARARSDRNLWGTHARGKPDARCPVFPTCSSD